MSEYPYVNYRYNGKDWVRVPVPTEDGYRNYLRQCFRARVAGFQSGDPEKIAEDMVKRLMPK